jgi:hypothetical protein
MFDARRVRELCNPLETAAVEPPRTSSAVITGSSPISARSLLCYNARLSKTVRSSAAVALANLAPGVRLNPSQARHSKRSLRAGNPIYTAPANGFPAPNLVETTKAEMVCLPTQVLDVRAPAE